MNKGFTLIELLIALAISGVIMTGVYAAFKSQQDSYLSQDQVAEMQQNIRAGLYVMSKDLRMAGYDPSGDAGAGIVAAKKDAIVITIDYNGDGDTGDDGENIGYDLYNSNAAESVVLGRAASKTALTLSEVPTGSGHYEVTPQHQPLALNIEKLEFYYTLADGTQTTTPTPAQFKDIRAVVVSILAITGHGDRKFTNTQRYTSASSDDWKPPTPDNYRRRFQTMTIKCRNLGL